MTNQETIHRFNFENHFTTLPNQTVEDPNLSWGAKGLLWYMVSRPKDWKIHRKQLASVYKGDRQINGKDAINGWFDELIQGRYVVYTRRHPKTKLMIHRYDVFPLPIEQIQKMFPELDIPDMDIPSMDKSTPIPNNKEETRKEASKQASQPIEKEQKTDLEEKVHALKEINLLPEQAMQLSRINSLEDILKATELMKARGDVDNPFTWLKRCLRDKWWLEANNTKYSRFLSLKIALSDFIKKNQIKEIDVNEKWIHLNLSSGGTVLKEEQFINDDVCVNVANFINSRFKDCKDKLVYDMISHTKGFIIC
jgi:hypothetical protein